MAERRSSLFRGIVILVLLAALFVAVGLLCPLVGSTFIPLGDLFSRNSLENDVLMQFRLPRVLFGLVAGLALALGGVVFQAILRNDLAEPYTLGVSGGATLGALVCLRLHLLNPAFTQPAGAFLGATAAVLIIYGLSRARGARSHPATLLLAGVTLNILFGAAILFVQYLSEPYEAFLMIRWMMGGLDDIAYRTLAWLSAAVLAVFLLLLYHARRLNLLTLGDDTAQHLGVSVEQTRLVVLAATSFLTAAVVAHSGPIGFVGLIVPHMMRRIIGPDHRLLLPAAALFGGAFLTLCDTVGRAAEVWSGALLPRPLPQLPVGIITAACGAPFFLFLLLKRNAGRG